MKRSQHVGHATLELLVEPYIVPILRALMDGPRRPAELEKRLPDVPHSAIARRLTELRRRGLARHERHSGLPPAAEYSLTPPGRMILGVTAAAERWERSWTTENGDGLIALRMIGDQHTREILLALAAGPRSAASIIGDVDLTRSPLRQRLGHLVTDAIIERHPGDARATYSLTASARDLMLVSIAAARWAWEFARPKEPPPAANVARVLKMYAPAVNLAADLRGLVRLSVGDGENATVHLLVEHRSLRPLFEPPASAPDAACSGGPLSWCDALLMHRWNAIRLTGEVALLGAILPCLARRCSADSEPGSPHIT